MEHDTPSFSPLFPIREFTDEYLTENWNSWSMNRLFVYHSANTVKFQSF